MFSFVGERDALKYGAHEVRSMETIEPMDPSPEHAKIFSMLEQGLHLMQKGMQRLRERVRPAVAMTEGIRPEDLFFLEQVTHALFPPSKPLPYPDGAVLGHLGEDVVLSLFELALTNQSHWPRFREMAEQIENPVFVTRLLDGLYEEKSRQGALCEKDVHLLTERIHAWTAAVHREADETPIDLSIARIREIYWRQECEPLTPEPEALHAFQVLLERLPKLHQFECDRDRVRAQAVRCLLRLGWDEAAKDVQTTMEDPIGAFESTLLFAQAFADRHAVAEVVGFPPHSYRTQPRSRRWEKLYRSALELYDFQTRFPYVGATKADLSEWRAILLRAQLHLNLRHDADKLAASIQPSFERAEHVYAPLVDHALVSQGDVSRVLEECVRDMGARQSEEFVATHLGLLELRAGLAVVRKQYKVWKTEPAASNDTLIAYLRGALQRGDGISGQLFLILLPPVQRAQLFSHTGWEQPEIALGGVLLGQVERLYPEPKQRHI